MNDQFSPVNDNKSRLNKNDYLRFLIQQLASDQGDDQSKVYNDCLVPHSIFRIGKKPNKDDKPQAAHAEDEEEQEREEAENKEMTNDCLKVGKMKIYEDAIAML